MVLGCLSCFLGSMLLEEATCCRIWWCGYISNLILGHSWLWHQCWFGFLFYFADGEWNCPWFPCCFASWGFTPHGFVFTGFNCWFSSLPDWFCFEPYSLVCFLRLSWEYAIWRGYLVLDTMIPLCAQSDSRSLLDLASLLVNFAAAEWNALKHCWLVLWALIWVFGPWN